MDTPRTGRSLQVILRTLVLGALAAQAALRADLPEIRKSGVLRHLGIRYANFVTGSGDGMDVDLLRLFAASLGVRYQYVLTDWDTVLEDLTGPRPKGDLIANGFTILPARKKAVDFSRAMFPSQIWLVARADSAVAPIRPTGSVDRDIARVRALLRGRKVLSLKRTCLDPSLYAIADTGAEVLDFRGSLNELAPALINGEAEMTILDVPDALVALDKWPGKIKIIGPISPPQEMAAAFPKTSPGLRRAFDQFLARCREDGTYDRIVRRYYPTVNAFFPEFFVRK